MVINSFFDNDRTISNTCDTEFNSKIKDLLNSSVFLKEEVSKCRAVKNWPLTSKDITKIKDLFYSSLLLKEVSKCSSIKKTGPQQVRTLL